MAETGKKSIVINRAPVLTLRAAVVARRLGCKWEKALTFGKAVAGLNAQAKGRRPRRRPLDLLLEILRQSRHTPAQQRASSGMSQLR